jgi:hypothetical protein
MRCTYNYSKQAQALLDALVEVDSACIAATSIFEFFTARDQKIGDPMPGGNPIPGRRFPVLIPGSKRTLGFHYYYVGGEVVDGEATHYDFHVVMVEEL